MATVEQIARVLAEHGNEHYAALGGDVWCTTCDRPIGHSMPTCAEDDAVVYAHQAEQIAALDGATSTEWGVELGEGRGIAVWSEKTCRMFAAEVDDATLVSRQVTEWRAAE